MQCDTENEWRKARCDEGEGAFSDPPLYVDVQPEHHESPTSGMTGILASPSMLVNDSSDTSMVRKTHEHDHKERRRPIRTMPSVRGETVATNPATEGKDKVAPATSLVPKVLIGWVVLGRFKLLRELGKGSFGHIFHARDINTQQEVAIKVEKRDIKVPQLKQEVNVYKHLRGMPGFPRLIAEGEENNLKMIVIDRLGHNIEDLLELCGGRFSLKTVLLLADQMLLRTQQMHSRGLLHRDIKPDNFLTGLGENAGTIYAVDFGLSKFYIDPKTGKHIGQREKNLTSLVGTARYCSINSHHGAQLSRRDDLETIGYVLVYLACRGLPWQGVKAANLPEKYEKIGQIKEQISTTKLCAGLPSCFQKFIDYSRQLAFEEEPDYEMCKEMFRSTFQLCRLKNDRIFDWTGMLDRGSLTVTIIEARNLVGKETGGTSNPYCTLWLSSLGKKRMASTKVVHADLNPVWENAFDFVATEPADVLMIEVWSKSGRLSMDKFLGRLQLALAQLQNKVSCWRPSFRLCRPCYLSRTNDSLSSALEVTVPSTDNQGRMVCSREEVPEVSRVG